MLFRSSTDKHLPLGMSGRVCIDPTGEHWFVQADSGLYTMNPKTMEIAPLPNGLSGHGFVSDDGRYVLTMLPNRSWQLSRSGEWKPLLTLRALKGVPSQLKVSKNGGRIAILMDDRTVTVFDVQTGKRVGKFFEDERFTAADLSPDGKVLLTGNLWGDVKFWDVETGAVLFDPPAHNRTVWSASFSLDGSMAITTSDDDTARLWDAETGELKTVLAGHSNTVYDAEFSPDMRRIVTSSRDLTARIWDRETGRQLVVLDGHYGEVLSAQFTPDGKSVVTGGADGMVRRWSSEEHSHTDRARHAD